MTNFKYKNNFWSISKITAFVIAVIAISSCKNELPEAGSIDDLTPPEAKFGYAQLSSANFLQVTFTNTSTSATNYEWDFGDGSNSTDFEPVHIYDTEGTYTVSLTAIDDLGASSEIDMEITLSEPDAFIPPISEPGFEDNSDILGCGDGNNDGRDCWRNSALGGVIQITNSPVFAGDQAAKLTGDAGDQRIGYQLLTVTEQTNYDVSFVYTMKDDQPGWLTVSILDGPASSHAEALAGTIGSVTVNDQSDPDTYLSQIVSFNSGPNTEVAIYFFNEGTVETRLDNFSIDLGSGGPIPPNANFSYEADPADFLQVNFSNLSLNADTYMWDFGDSMTSSEENPTHVYAAEGTYTVTLTAINSGGEMDDVTMDVTVAMPSAIVINNPSLDDFPVNNDNREAWRNATLETDADAVFGESTYVLQMSSTARTGAFAGKLPTMENSADPRRWMYQAIEVVPNTDYIISGWIRNKDSGVGSTVTFTIYDAPFDDVANLTNAEAIINSVDFTDATGHDTNEWTEATIEFNSGSSSEVVLFISNDYTLNGDSDTEESETFLDDFSISEQ